MPKTNFNQTPDLPKLEEQVQKFWEENDSFKKSVEMRSADKSYVFYDGPPFATGMPHYGHLLSSTTKDVIPRYWTMKGYRVERVWGWDCHGLPIENMIEKKLDIKGGKKGIEDLGIDTFNAACRSEVMRLDTEWEKIIGRIGRWVDFKNNYKTMDKTFMESVWWGFKQLYEKDLVYQGKKVILYCPRCATPLSNFEIAMDNSYKDIKDLSVVTEFEIKDTTSLTDGDEKVFALAWTTTPWTLPGNLLLAVNPDATYLLFKGNEEGKMYIAMKDRMEYVMGDDDYVLVKEMKGSDLVGLTYQPLFSYFADTDNAFRVVAGDFVTGEDGTGIVHIAPGFGEDDYALGQKENVETVIHVDENGKFVDTVTDFVGLPVKPKDDHQSTDIEIIKYLAHNEKLWSKKKITHSYPHCYRCETPLINYALPAWFINVQAIKDNLIKQNEKVNWYPEHLKHGRFLKGLETAPDWNVSRSRYWGTPMPIWESEDGKQRRIIGSITELEKWAVNPDEVKGLDDIHRESVDHIEVWVDDDKKVTGKRIPEVFDCWVESGSMPFAAVHYPFENKEWFEDNFPAQFVSEYIAQTRAWFYTMHVMSTGVFERAPFENVLTTGTILAEDGTKMSKSKKNYPDPLILIDNYGVDSLRLYLMSSTVMKGENLSFNEREVGDIRRKVFIIWWNMISFYQQFADQAVGISKPDFEPKDVMDKWLLSKLNGLIDQTTQHMDAYDVVKASRELMSFVDELSTWYLRLSRDRLREEDNQEMSQVFGYTLYTLAQLIAPFSPFFAEIVHHNLVDDTTSIHHTNWPQSERAALHPVLEEKMEEVKKAVEMVRSERRNLGIKLRQPLANLEITSPIETPKDNLLDVIKQETNVKMIKWLNGKVLEVKLDTNLTPELEAEGQAREIVRSIQVLRKEKGLTLEESIKVQLPEWPEEWEEYIREKTNADSLVRGETTELL